LRRSEAKHKDSVRDGRRNLADVAGNADSPGGVESACAIPLWERRQKAGISADFDLTTYSLQPIRFSSGETAAPTVSGHRAGAEDSPAGCYFPNIRAPSVGAQFKGETLKSRTVMTKSRKGFTLVELAVVIVIIGVLAAFGVPQFLKSVERSKAAEAFNYLSAVRSAQERYLAKEGIYCCSSDKAKLDITQVAPKYFDVGDISEDHSVTNNPTWSLTLTRKTATSSYGGYTVTFTQGGFATASSDSSIMAADCMEICPMGN
jgi:type IV pilus assembly protein PilA